MNTLIAYMKVWSIHIHSYSFNLFLQVYANQSVTVLLNLGLKYTENKMITRRHARNMYIFT